MNDNDRLAEIDRQAAMDRRWLANTQEGPGAVACISRGLLDKAVEQRDWLIARVRALEAQAADAKVVEAAEALKDLGTPYRNGLRAFLKMNDNNWDGYFDDGWDVAEKLEALDAALAARKPSE